jgi:hypothetical protein
VKQSLEALEEGQKRMRRILHAALLVDPDVNAERLINYRGNNTVIYDALLVCRENFRAHFYPNLVEAILATRQEAELLGQPLPPPSAAPAKPSRPQPETPSQQKGEQRGRSSA